MWYAKDSNRKPIPQSVELALQKINAMPDLYVKIESLAALARNLKTDCAYPLAMQIFLTAIDLIISNNRSQSMRNICMQHPSFIFIFMDTAKCFEKVSSFINALQIYIQLDYPDSQIIDIKNNLHACKAQLMRQAYGYMGMLEVQLLKVNMLLDEASNKPAHERTTLLSCIDHLIQTATPETKIPTLALQEALTTIREIERVLSIKFDAMHQLEQKIAAAKDRLQGLRHASIELTQNGYPCLVPGMA